MILMAKKQSPKNKIENYYAKKGEHANCVDASIHVGGMKLGWVNDGDPSMLQVFLNNYKLGSKIYGYIVDYYEEYAKAKGFENIQFSDDRLSLLQVLLDKGYLPKKNIVFWQKKL